MGAGPRSGGVAGYARWAERKGWVAGEMEMGHERRPAGHRGGVRWAGWKGSWAGNDLPPFLLSISLTHFLFFLLKFKLEYDTHVK
jgi:hypothetical protein